MSKEETKKEEYVTVERFDKAMASIANSFESQRKELDEFKGQILPMAKMVLQEVQQIRQEHREAMQSMSVLNRAEAKQDVEIERIKVRVTKLETKFA